MQGNTSTPASLGSLYPIVQAPMAGVSTPQLAAAISNAGGLGSIAIGAVDVAQARAMIAATKALTGKPFNVNVFCHASARADPRREAQWLQYLQPYFAEFGAQPPVALNEIYKSFVDDAAMLALLVEQAPAVVSFHFGLPPATAIAALKQAGITLLATATNLEEAAAIERAGVDWIVAQGMEAGGHHGAFDPSRRDGDGIGTLALVRTLAQHSALPVIAAGGIMDGRGIAAAMMLGAQAVQLGTAFILTPESSADAAYRAAMQSDAARHTRQVTAISGRAARGIVGRWMTEVESAAAPAPPDYPIAYDAAKTLHAAAAAQGNHDFAVNWAGQGAPLARAMPAADLLETLVNEWRQAGAAAQR
ncbi:MAG: 2-nitropropane dioxygenase [Herbaspirillum sp.]|jgi:nitronate monooxygenase|nr:2-nitropropane dioxygenase [Herbaspirillum sp.]